MIELEPCPFCGEEAKIMATKQGVAVVCTHINMGCGCRTDFYLDWSSLEGLSPWRRGKTAVEKAVESWNRRMKDA